MPTCALRKAMLGGLTELVEEQWWSASMHITLELRPRALRLITFAFSWDSHRMSLPPSLRSSRTNLQSSNLLAKLKSVIFTLVFFRGFWPEGTVGTLDSSAGISCLTGMAIPVANPSFFFKAKGAQRLFQHTVLQPRMAQMFFQKRSAANIIQVSHPCTAIRVKTCMPHHQEYGACAAAADHGNPNHEIKRTSCVEWGLVVDFLVGFDGIGSSKFAPTHEFPKRAAEFQETAPSQKSRNSNRGRNTTTQRGCRYIYIYYLKYLHVFAVYTISSMRL